MTHPAIIKHAASLLLFLTAPLHADFVKGDLYKVRGLKDEITIGRKDAPADVAIAPEIRTSFKFETKQEHYFLSAKRDRAVKSVPLSDTNGVTFSVEGESDAFTLVGDRLKWDVVYAADPRKSSGDYVETWTLDYPKGVSLHYQGELSAADVAAGAFRAEDVVGSYAVYSDVSGKFVDDKGNTLADYGTGKLAHVYRPKILDSNGAEVWGVLNVTGKKMAVTIPGDFLDKAVFPVTLDPDFGYQSVGATEQGFNAFCLISVATPTIAGVGVSMSAYLSNPTDLGTRSAKLRLYKVKDHTPAVPGDTVSRTNFSSTPQWYSFIFANAATTSTIILPEPRGYLLCILGSNAGSGTVTGYYDDVADGSAGKFSSILDYIWPDPIIIQSNNARKNSIYVTYTLTASPYGRGSWSNKNSKLRFFMRRQ